MKRDRRVVGDPILRKIADKIGEQEFGSKKLNNLITDMRDTLKASKSGIAISAPQIGESKAVVVVELKKTPTRTSGERMSLVLLNPKIISYSTKKVKLRDGCMSVGAEEDPLFGWTTRSEKVEIEYQDEQGNKHVEKYSGFKAQVLQHEVDHLNGILFIERVTDPKTYIHASEYKKQLKTKTK